MKFWDVLEIRWYFSVGLFRLKFKCSFIQKTDKHGKCPKWSFSLEEFNLGWFSGYLPASEIGMPDPINDAQVYGCMLGQGLAFVSSMWWINLNKKLRHRTMNSPSVWLFGLYSGNPTFSSKRLAMCFEIRLVTGCTCDVHHWIYARWRFRTLLHGTLVQ